MGHYRPTIQQVVKKYNITPNKALMLGGRFCTESQEYWEAGFDDVIFVEADPGKIEEARKNTDCYGYKIFNYAMYDKDDEIISFNRVSDDAASSLLNLHDATYRIYPNHHVIEIIQVPTITVDTLFERHNLKFEEFNYVALDIQGCEGIVLKKAVNFFMLAPVQIVDVELDFTKEGFYKDGVNGKELIRLFSQHGFTLREMFPHYVGAEQCDAILVR